MRKIGFLFLFVLGFNSCKYEETYQKYLDLSDAKSEIISFSGELDEDEIDVTSDYFVTLKNLAYQVKYDKKIKKYLNKRFDKYFNKKDCVDIFLDKIEYHSVLSKCEVNGFFVCAEEAKYYVEIIKEVKKSLEHENVKDVLKDKVCNQKMKDLGV